jgi:hypothetical protein
LSIVLEISTGYKIKKGLFGLPEISLVTIKKQVSAWPGKVYGTTSSAWKLMVMLTSITPDREGIPSALVLYPNHPNPFNRTNTISHALLPRATRVSLHINNVIGRLVRRPIDAEQTAGKYSVVWDTQDDFELLLANGIFLCRMLAGAECAAPEDDFG